MTDEDGSVPIDAARWDTFERILDELLDDYVHTAQHAARAEQLLQRRAQDMRECYEAWDHGRNR